MPTPTLTPTPVAAAVAAVVDTSATVIKTEDDNEFDNAFAALSADAPAADTPAAAAPAVDTPAPAVDAAAPAVDTPAPAVDAAAPAVDTPAPAADTPAPAPAADPMAALQAKMDAMAAQMAAMTEAAKAPPADEPAPDVPVYTADEQATLDKYRTEWPDIVAGEALARRAEYRQVVKYIFDQIGPQLAALAETSQAVSSRGQYADLVALVPDYDAVRDPVLAWVEKQPEYLKNAYQQVTNSGTPADVADLIARFKRETNYVSATPAPAAKAAPVAVPAAPAAAKPAVAALPAAAASVVAALKPVKSGRTEPASGEDSNDFDGAFKEFASKA